MKAFHEMTDQERRAYVLTLLKQTTAQYPERMALLIDDNDALSALSFGITDTVLSPAQHAQLIRSNRDKVMMVKTLVETAYLLGYTHGHQPAPTVQLEE